MTSNIRRPIMGSRPPQPSGTPKDIAALITQSCMRIANATQETMLVNSRMNSVILQDVPLPAPAQPPAHSTTSSNRLGGEAPVRRNASDKRILVSFLTCVYFFRLIILLPGPGPSIHAPSDEATELSGSPTYGTSLGPRKSYQRRILHTMERESK